MSSKKPRSLQSVSDMVRSMAAVGLLVALLATFVWITRVDSEKVIRELDWKAIAIGAQTRTELPTFGPIGLANDWVATSARIEKVGDSEVWRVGMVTPKQQYVSVIVSKADIKKLIKTYVNFIDEKESTKEINGKTYTAIEDESNKVLAISENGISILTYGTSDWDEMIKFTEKLAVPTN